MAASCQRIKSVPDDARKDLISGLPEDVKQRILECLPTRDAARTALLSTHWNGVWLRHGRLVFDQDFLIGCVRKWGGYKPTSFMNIIHNVLFLRLGPVKKFTLHIYSDHKREHADIRRWILFLSRNGVEELNLSLYGSYQHNFKLPFCIFVCPSIKKLRLYGFRFESPVNASCIFPGVTSLVFENVWFSGDDNGSVSSLPKLEELAFRSCYDIQKFEISAPKLRRLFAFGFINFGISESRWFPVHLEAIKALYLSPDLVLTVAFPMATSLQVIKLYDLSFACGKHFIFTMQVLQKSPNLCELEIIVGEKDKWYDDTKAASRILEDPDSYVINKDLKMLNTVKIESFTGCKLEILLVKTLLSKSPSLEKLVIQELVNMDPAMALDISRELLHFPRASPKAQLVFMKA